MNKEELLGKLYTLRAGLSLVAKEKDNMVIEEKKVKKIDNQIDKVTKDELSHLSDYNDCLHKKNNTGLGFVKSYSYDRNMEELEKKKNKHRPLMAILGAIGVTLVSLIPWGLFSELVVLGLISSLFENFNHENDFLALILSAVILSALSGIIYAVVHISIYKSTNKKIVDLNQELEDAKNKYNEDSNKQKDALQKEADSALAKRNEQTAIKNDLIAKKNAQIEECKKINAGYKQIGTTLYTAIVEEFKGLIDARDFKNVDLLIYFIETNRADDLKEALHQVDLRTQTDEIVNAIHEATETITNNIRMGFNVLSQQINYEFSSLNTRISNTLTAIDSNNALFDKNLHIINNNIKELCTAQNAQNALLEKANVSSTTLVNDIKYITNYNYK